MVVGVSFGPIRVGVAVGVRVRVRVRVRIRGRGRGRGRVLLDLEVVGETLLAQVEVGLDGGERLLAAARAAHLDRVGVLARVDHLLAELRVEAWLGLGSG